MLIKVAFSQQQLLYRRTPRPEEVQTAEFLAKTARNRSERIALDLKNNYYIDSWAVSAYEKFGLNENADGFERDELRPSHRTFVGSWVCCDHENWDQTLAVGSNVDSVYMPDEYVRVAMAVDRKLSEARRPGLERKIEAGIVTDTSMGVYASRSMCTIPRCANVASDERGFCDHVRLPMRGTVLCNSETNYKPIRCGELNRGLLFFENTIITSDEGADRNAKILSKLAASEGRRGREIEAVLKAIREIATDADPAGVATLARLVHRMREEMR